MIIEVTGVPCAGKTTLLPSIYREYSEQYNNLQYASEFLDALAFTKLRYLAVILRPLSPRKRTGVLRNLLISYCFISSFFVFPRLHILVLRSIFYGSRSFKAINSYYWKFGKFYTIKRNIGDESIIIDEGSVHAIQSIFVPSVIELDEDFSRLRHYLELAPLPDLLLVVHNRNTTELIERIEKRGHHRIGAQESRKFIEKCIKTEDVAIDVLTKRSKLVVRLLPTEYAKRNTL